MKRRIGMKGMIYALAFLVAAYAVIQYGYSAKGAGLVQYKMKSPDFHYSPWVYFLYAHIVTAVLALVIGPFQLFRKPAGARLKRHRAFGFVYVLCIGISGLVNLILSFDASGGWIARTGFCTLDLIWIAATFRGVQCILKHKTDAHRKWMARSYALTFAGVTLRLWLFPLEHLIGDFDQAYRVSAWISWVPNLLLVLAVQRFAKARSGNG